MQNFSSQVAEIKNIEAQQHKNESFVVLTRTMPFFLQTFEFQGLKVRSS